MSRGIMRLIWLACVSAALCAAACGASRVAAKSANKRPPIGRGAPSPPSRPCPSVARDDLLTCLTNLDANEDGTLTIAEIDAWIAANTACLPLSMNDVANGTLTVAACDTDASGNLTMTDWASPDSCLALRAHQLVACYFCVKCAVYPPP